MTKSQSRKQKFRQSKVWKELRHQKNVEQAGKDPITKKKLYKMANLHHLDQRAENYENISDTDRFVMVNSQTHDNLHWLYKYWIKDPLIIDRVVHYLEKMREYSCD